MYFDFDNKTLIWLGIIFACLFFIYIYVKNFTYQTKIVESLTNKEPSVIGTLEETSEKLKAATEKTKDALYLDKYRKDYENLIIDLEDNSNATNLGLLQSLATQASNGQLDDMLKIMGKMNTINTFRGTLNDAMKYLDSN